MKEIQICTGYRCDGRTVEQFDPSVMDRCECIYRKVRGWDEDISPCRTFADLPAAAKEYVDNIERLLGRPVGIISVGPERSQTIVHSTGISGLAPQRDIAG